MTKMLKGQTINKQRKKFNTIKSTAKKKPVLRLHENNFQIFSCFCLMNLINKKTLKRIWSEKSQAQHIKIVPKKKNRFNTQNLLLCIV